MLLLKYAKKYMKLKFNFLNKSNETPDHDDMSFIDEKKVWSPVVRDI